MQAEYCDHEVRLHVAAASLRLKRSNLSRVFRERVLPRAERWKSHAREPRPFPPVPNHDVGALKVSFDETVNGCCDMRTIVHDNYPRQTLARALNDPMTEHKLYESIMHFVRKKTDHRTT